MDWTDETLIPFGKYRDTPLKDLPAAYLEFMYNHFKDKSLFYKTTPYQRQFISYIESHRKELIS